MGLIDYHKVKQTGNKSRRIRPAGFVLRARKLGNMYILASNQNLNPLWRSKRIRQISAKTGLCGQGVVG